MPIFLLPLQFLSSEVLSLHDPCFQLLPRFASSNTTVWPARTQPSSSYGVTPTWPVSILGPSNVIISNQMESDSEILVIPPAPKTLRGYPSSIDVTQDHLLYFNGTSVVLQPLQNHHQSLTLNHGSDVAAAKISDNGRFIASIDVKGNLVISEICPDRILQVYKYEGVFANAKELAWSADGKKVCVVGEGKKVFGKVIGVETGITAGDIGSVTATLNSCSFRPERPFKLVMGGDEYIVKCFEGPPYSFVKSDKSHSGFIIRVKYSPKGTYFLTGGADRKLVLYDGKSFQKIGQKSEAHSGSIFGVDWISEEHLVSVSSDKLIKIWDLQFQEKFVIETTSPENLKDPKKIGLFLVAVKACNDLIYVLTLEGDILVYNSPLVGKESRLIRQYSGARSKIVKTLQFDQHNLILLDSGGRIINFNLLTRRTNVCAPQIDMNGITNGFLAQGESKKRLIILTTNGSVWVFEGEEVTQLKLVKKIQSIEFKNISEGPDYDSIIGLSNNKLVVYDLAAEKVRRETTIAEDITFIASNESFLLSGTIKGQIHLFTTDLQKIATTTLSTFKISHIGLFPVAPSVFRCLFGDTCGGMRMVEISAEGFKVLKETMGGHSSVITGAGVSGQCLYTFSMDGKICVWADDSLQRLREIKQTVSGGIVGGLVWEKIMVVSGGDLVTKVIPLKE